jgi:hypothetical protein
MEKCRAGRRPSALFAILVAVAITTSSAASAAVIGPTAQTAALAVTKKFALHDIRAWNRPGTSYTLGTCHVLHRRPWVAYVCDYWLHGIPHLCHNLLTIAVKRLPDGNYRAEEVKWHNLRDATC